MKVRPITLTDANAFVSLHHRHHAPVRLHRFSIAAEHGGKVVGVVIVNHPSARHLCDGRTLEVLRLCTDGTRNACSFLYGACARAAKSLGWSRIITYTLATEGGASLRASGWKCEGEAGGGSWERTCGRVKGERLLFPLRRVDQPMGKKVRWSRALLAAEAAREKGGA